MDRIFTVPLKGRSSEVWFAAADGDLKAKLGSYGKNVLYVFDDNTAKVYGEPLPGNSLVLPHGESEKDWRSVDKILTKAFELGLARDSLFIGFGGGVVLDMTAFASSIFMRGAACVLVPTTLLAMVDATLGGKTGVDYQGAKNAVGTFFPARDVLIDSRTLSTLPEKEWMCGLGEVVKHAFLSADHGLHDFLSGNRQRILARDAETVSEMIRLSLEVKIWYITRDPEERLGIRSSLNLGHTFGHAWEALSNFTVSHGEGVAWGTARALETGIALGVTDRAWGSEALGLLSSYGFALDGRIAEEDFPSFLKAVSKDKKKKGGEVRFILMEGQGKPVLRVLSEAEIKKAVTR